jgi:hypothetical protein
MVSKMRNRTLFVDTYQLFEGIYLSPSSGNICTLNMEAPGFSEARVCIDPVTLHQTQEDKSKYFHFLSMQTLTLRGRGKILNSAK